MVLPSAEVTAAVRRFDGHATVSFQDAVETVEPAGPSLGEAHVEDALETRVGGEAGAEHETGAADVEAEELDGHRVRLGVEVGSALVGEALDVRQHGSGDDLAVDAPQPHLRCLPGRPHPEMPEPTGSHVQAANRRRPALGTPPGFELLGPGPRLPHLIGRGGQLAFDRELPPGDVLRDEQVHDVSSVRRRCASRRSRRRPHSSAKLSSHPSISSKRCRSSS